MSEQFLNCTSANLGYTVPFTSIYAEKYVTEDKSKTDTLEKLNTTQKKQTMQNTAEQNYPGLVTLYDTRPGNKVGLFYNAPEPTRGVIHCRQTELCQCTTLLDCCLYNERRQRLSSLPIRSLFITDWNQSASSQSITTTVRHTET